METSPITRRSLLAGAAAPWLSATARRPNFLFILSDDHHFQCLGAAGNPHIQTPNLDRLATRGVLFRNAIISTAQCAPSRGVLMSGRESSNNGMLSNGSQSFRPDLGLTVVEQARRSGYETALIGKWHAKPRPAECGFARTPLWLDRGSSPYQNPTLQRGADGAPERTSGHITDLFTDAAVEYIRNRPADPFLLWLTYNAPHEPWFAAPKYRSMYAGKDSAALAPPAHVPGKAFDWSTYYAVITHMDEAIGRVIEAVDRASIWGNTQIVFLGDNGYMCGAKGLGGKIYPWEESIRVPMIAAGGGVKQGATVDTPVSSVDVPATWLDSAGIRPANPLDGTSLSRLFATGKDDREYAFSVWDDGSAAAAPVAKLLMEPYRIVRTTRHKLVLWESRKLDLYDLGEDPAEEKNRAEDPAYGAVRKRLYDRLAERLRKTGDRAAAWLS
jgi:arylsulfatase A-like enzyme